MVTSAQHVYVPSEAFTCGMMEIPTPCARGTRITEGMMSDLAITLMFATLTDRRDFGDDWLLERKFDGERCVARKDGDAVRLESRTGKDLTGTYPEVRAAMAGQRPDELLVDGEVVAFDGEQTSFSRLQQRLGISNPSPPLVGEFPVVLLRLRPPRGRR